MKKINKSGTIVVSITGKALEGDYFKGLQQAMISAVAAGTERIKTATREEIRRQRLIDTGTLRNSVKSTVSKVSVSNGANRILGQVGTPIAYALPLEIGAKPFFAGAKVYKGPLKLWVERKLKIKGKAAERVAFAILIKFSKEGIKPRRFFEIAANKMRPRINRLLEATFRRIGEEYGAR